MSDESTVTTTRRWPAWLLALILVIGLAVGAVAGALVGSIGQKKGGATVGHTEVVTLDDTVVDPAEWGRNFPRQYDLYAKTADFTPTAHSPALVARTPTADDPRTETTMSKLVEDPRLVTMWKGYAFAIDYRHRATTPTR